MEGKKHAGGSPTKYKKEYCEQARKLCLLGYTDKQLADFFGVSKASINNWKIKHPEFLDSLKNGKVIPDSNVAQSLYNRAIGFNYTETKTVKDADGNIITEQTINKFVPPDTGAAFIWLKNRQPVYWKDKQIQDENKDIIGAFKEIANALNGGNNE